MDLSLRRGVVVVTDVLLRTRLEASTVQVLALAMAAAHGVVWVLVTRWGRAGRTAQLRASSQPPPLLARAGYGALAIPLLYPVAVAISPQWWYEGVANWSSPMEVTLLAIGLGLWGVGSCALVWSARTLGGYLDVDGVSEDHVVVTSGPYRYVRHPVYASFATVTVGLGVVFRSYLVAVVAVTWFVAASWWAADEETLLASPEGLGDAYRTYSARTGRFLPRLRR